MTTPLFHIKAKDGRIEWKSDTQQAQFSMWLSKNDGKDLVLKVAEKKNFRTLSQNAYYHHYLNVIEAETGNDHKDLHEYFKRKFLPPRTIAFDGDQMKIPGSTTTLSKADMGEYLDKICALTNVPLPDPEASGYLPS